MYRDLAKVELHVKKHIYIVYLLHQLIREI